MTAAALVSAVVARLGDARLVVVAKTVSPTSTWRMCRSLGWWAV